MSSKRKKNRRAQSQQRWRQNCGISKELGVNLYAREIYSAYIFTIQFDWQVYWVGTLILISGTAIENYTHRRRTYEIGAHFIIRKVFSASIWCFIAIMYDSWWVNHKRSAVVRAMAMALVWKSFYAHRMWCARPGALLIGSLGQLWCHNTIIEIIGWNGLGIDTKKKHMKPKSNTKTIERLNERMNEKKEQKYYDKIKNG